MSTSAPCARSTDTDAFDDAWGDLIREVLRPIMAAAVVALWGVHLALLFSSSSNESLIRALVLTALAVLAGAASYQLLGTRPRLAAQVWCLDLAATGLASLVLLRQPLTLFLVPIALLLAGLLLGFRGSVVVALPTLAMVYPLAGSDLARPGQVAQVAALSLALLFVGTILQHALADVPPAELRLRLRTQHVQLEWPTPDELMAYLRQEE